MHSTHQSPSKSSIFIVFTYSCLTVLALAIAMLREEPNILVCTPLSRWNSWLNHGVSGMLGIILALLVVLLTRILVRSWSYARLLHQSLRHVALAMGPQQTWLMAIMSSIGEETLFRGALVPSIGIIGSSVLFGILHQTPGRARWVWVTFAFIMGLMFAFLFRWTGSLVGPLIAHALINAINFRFLLTYNFDERPSIHKKATP